MVSPGLNQWHLSNTGAVTEEPISSDIILISLPFNASNRDHGALVFEDDCITPFDDDSFFEVDTTVSTSNQFDGFIQFNTTLKMNVTALMLTQYWNPFVDTIRGGWVEACVETYLAFNDELNLGNDDSQQKVDFKNNLLNITVSLTANFEVDNVDVQGGGDTKENGINIDHSGFTDSNGCVASSLGCTSGESSRLDATFASTIDGTVVTMLMILAGLLVAGYFIGRRNDRLTTRDYAICRNENTPGYGEIYTDDVMFPVKGLHSTSNNTRMIDTDIDFHTACEDGRMINLCQNIAVEQLQNCFKLSN